MCCVCVCAVNIFNTLSHEPLVDGQWVDIINLLSGSASLLAVSPLLTNCNSCQLSCSIVAAFMHPVLALPSSEGLSAVWTWRLRTCVDGTESASETTSGV